jgi:tetratricopeptide (TPR) repeat protein
MDEFETQKYIEQEFKKALYKLEDNDFATAESIFENIALTYDNATAWAYIGAIKMGQVSAGTTTVDQALKCFHRAVALDPSSKSDYQKSWIALSMGQLEALRDSWFDTYKHKKDARHAQIWNGALMGLSIGLGNQKTKGNNVFRGVAGVAGAGYAASGIVKNTTNARSAKEALRIIEETMRQVLRGAKQFCSDDDALYKPFLEKVYNFRFANRVLSAVNEN